MLGDGFRYSIEDAFQIIQLARVLNLYDDNFILAVACLDVHTIELIRSRLLVALAFKNLDDIDFFSQKNGEETFQHTEVRFLSQKAFDGPVETDVFVL